jgi:hypothetical protein
MFTLYNAVFTGLFLVLVFEILIDRMMDDMNIIYPKNPYDSKNDFSLVGSM